MLQSSVKQRHLYECMCCVHSRWPHATIIIMKPARYTSMSYYFYVTQHSNGTLTYSWYSCKLVVTIGPLVRRGSAMQISKLVEKFDFFYYQISLQINSHKRFLLGRFMIEIQRQKLCPSIKGFLWFQYFESLSFRKVNWKKKPALNSASRVMHAQNIGEDWMA